MFNVAVASLPMLTRCLEENEEKHERKEKKPRKKKENNREAPLASLKITQKS